MVLASGGFGCGGLLFESEGFAGAICATMESWVCLLTSAASSFASMVESVAVGSGGGVLPPASWAASIFTPRTLPPVSASAKFMRFSRADELTHVSAFME